MMLYVCRQCGRWQDVSLAMSLQKAMLDGLFANASEEQKATMMDTSAFDCPKGHGAMVQVLANQRIMIWERIDEKG